MNVYHLINSAGEKAEPGCIFVYCVILPWSVIVISSKAYPGKLVSTLLAGLETMCTHINIHSFPHKSYCLHKKICWLFHMSVSVLNYQCIICRKGSGRNGNNNICVVNLVEAENQSKQRSFMNSKTAHAVVDVANCIEPKLLDRVQLQLFFKILFIQYIL